jgi:Core-2/I-Branching enzyme
MTQPLVVVVLSHRNSAQVARLAGRLRSGSNTVTVIHHDPYGETLELPRWSDVLRVPGARPAQWGSMGIVDAVLRSLRFVRSSIPELGWVVLVSGMDYPVRPVRAIEDELAAATVDAYARHVPVTAAPHDDDSSWQVMLRHRYLHQARIPCTSRWVTVPRRHPFHAGLQLFAGDMWVNLAARALHHVLDSPRADVVLRYLATVPVPDEAAVQTLLLSPDRDGQRLRVADDTRRWIRWAAGPPPPAHPELVTAADLPAIAASRAFFARKVDSTVDPTIIDQLDELAVGGQQLRAAMVSPPSWATSKETRG